jgi:flagellar hook assembly protein FlgD
MKIKYIQTFILLSLLSFLLSNLSGQDYLIQFQQNSGNPGGLNLETDLSLTGWTAFTTGNQSSNSWSSTRSLPFSFEFFGTSVTHYMCSQTGVLTFDTLTAVLPNENTNLPNVSLSDMSIAGTWDQFTVNPPTGANDIIYYKVFGTTPNRQLWIKWNSFKIGNLNSAYWAIVLEETSNNIYVVDMLSAGGGSCTVGVQENSGNAVQYGTNNLARAVNGENNSDNDYWAFFQPETVDLAVVDIINLPSLVIPLSTVNFEVVVQNFGESLITGESLDVWRLNGAPANTYAIADLNTGESDTISASVVASDFGRDSIIAAVQPVLNDANPNNDTLSTGYNVAVYDVSPISVDQPHLTMIPLTQATSVITEGTIGNNGPENTGDVNIEITNQLGTPVFSDNRTGITISDYSQESVTFNPWDASSETSGQYTISIYTDNFIDSDNSNDTIVSTVELSEYTMAYDNGYATNNVAIVPRNRNLMGTRFTLQNPDLLTSISMQISNNVTLADSFSIYLYSVVNDTPGVPLVRIYRGTFGSVGPLPALAQIIIPGGMPMMAGDFYVILDSDSTGHLNYPLSCDNTGLGPINIQNRFVGKSPGYGGGYWTFFEDINPSFGTYTPIIRIGLNESTIVHNYAVNSIDVNSCMIPGTLYNVVAEVQNTGNQPEVSVPIVLIEDGIQIGSPQQISLSPNETGNVIFNYTAPDVQDVVQLQVASLLGTDMNPANDTSEAFVRIFSSEMDIVFLDDFEDPLYTYATWDTAQSAEGVWTVYPEPWLNNYLLPITAHGNVFAADADVTGSGTQTITTAMFFLDLSDYDSVRLNIDSDWRARTTADTARINVSIDNRLSWITVVENAGVSARNEHISIDLTSLIAGSSEAWIAFESYQPGFDWWWVIDNVCVTAHEVAVGISDKINAIPQEYALYQNFPNPFNPITTIKYDLKQKTNVKITIYDLLGKEIRTLVNARQEAGHKTVTWDGSNNIGVQVASGIYIYRISTEEFTQTKKMVLMK